jgi:hypothetical protein
MDRGVVAFIASSGTGKTSLAAHLVSGGAPLVTDDILAVDATPDGVVAHPGGTLLHLADDEVSAIGSTAGDGRLKVFDERLDKLQLGADLITQPAPLAALYFLSRSSDIERLAITHLAPPSPKLLFSAAFLTYLQPPSRLMRQLELCAAVAASVPTFAVDVPVDYGAARLAEVVRDHAEGDW